MRTYFSTSVRARLVAAISLLMLVLILAISFAMLGEAQRSLSLVGTEVAGDVEQVHVHQREIIQLLVDEQVAMARANVEEKAQTLAALVANLTAVPLLTYDVGQLNKQCEAACREPGVLLCLVRDANGVARSTFVDVNRPRIDTALAADPHMSVDDLAARLAKSDGVIVVEHDIVMEGERIGQAVLLATMDSESRQAAAIRASSVELLKDVDNLAASIQKEISDQSARHTSRAMWQLMLVSGLALAAGMVGAIAISVSITRPLKRTAEVLGAINRGDFQQRVDVSGQDEVAVVASSVNHLAETLEAKRALESSLTASYEQLSRTNSDLSREVAERLQAEKQLEAAHKELVDAARRAGMAEIATGVLHNVGNVLNSVNVSVSVLIDRIRESKIEQLSRLCNLFDEHSDDLGAFITEDAKGKKIPIFLKTLTEHLGDEQTAIFKEIESLKFNVEHIKAIVTTQQSYTGMTGVIELVDLRAMLDTAVKLNSTSFQRHDINIECQYADLPELWLDKQKLLQVVINLLKNAKDAVMECPPGDRRIELQTARVDEDRVQIVVRDSGIGIPGENLTRIFSHGFTTKQKGHGFGLHSSANAAGEMGGSLTAASEGVGKGATFTLELPCEPGRASTVTFEISSSPAALCETAAHA